MEITYLGHSCFSIKTENLNILIDPYNPKIGYKEIKAECDVLLLTHDHPGHNYAAGVDVKKITISTPGEYELSDVFIYGLKTYHDKDRSGQNGSNSIYQIEADGFTLLHLGDLGHELSKETLENISGVDVLFIPVGGVYTIDAAAASKVISSIEPGIVIPMHYQTPNYKGDQQLDGVEKFLTEMGVEEVKTEAKLTLNKRVDIPDETKVIVLESK